MAEIFGMDAYTPSEIAQRIEQTGVAKAKLPLRALFTLAVLGGAFIGLGALYSVLVRADHGLSMGLRLAMAGLSFSLGLLLVVVAGAELFTGNNLLVMAWAERRISGAELLRNWTVVLAGNAAGAAGLALLVYWSGHPDMQGGAIAAEYLRIAQAKIALGPGRAFLLGVLCNALVCLAVWMAMAGRSVADKAVAVVFPVSAFVAAGFEHSVANLYLLPMALLLQAPGGRLGWYEVMANLLPVLAGNLVGGALLVGMVYRFIYHGPAETGARAQKKR
ncbi:formate transporter FocA [Pseudoduganella eburnea]|uniref:Formate transporter FocA n=1 Tax=Massilia eburnea TaxID=1776165 RepID=A0A6L6QC08_9BURK|nr:formate/nitrite transporter family protein [Massilia eburnea]MTW10012.1 formate transporter FocA [Massilia eburnea]